MSSTPCENQALGFTNIHSYFFSFLKESYGDTHFEKIDGKPTNSSTSTEPSADRKINLTSLHKIGCFCLFPAHKGLKATVQFLNVLRDPRFFVIVTTAFLMISVSLGFYPAITWKSLHFVCQAIFTYLQPHVVIYVVKFALFALVQLTIFGYGLRAFGRLGNAKFMNEYFPKLTDQTKPLK